EIGTLAVEIVNDAELLGSKLCAPVVGMAGGTHTQTFRLFALLLQSGSNNCAQSCSDRANPDHQRRVVFPRHPVRQPREVCWMQSVVGKTFRGRDTERLGKFKATELVQDLPHISDRPGSGDEHTS